MSEVEYSKIGIVQKPCRRCGKVFGCGAAANFCECFSVKLSPEVSARLKKEYDDCLCVACLEELNRRT